MCLLDAMIVLYAVGGSALGFTGMKLYKDIVRYKKSKNKTEPELDKQNLSFKYD